MEVIDYIRAGGPVMIPILLASVVGLATFLERLWALRRGRVLPTALMRELAELARQRRWGDALAACRKWDAPLARLAEVPLAYRHESRERIKSRIEEVGRREVADLERGVPILGTLSHLGTLLGLLGTVGGMILTFRVLGSSAEPDVGEMAVGISQALIATFSGLVVAIPAMIANRWLLGKVDALTVALEEASLRFLDAVLDAGGDEVPP